MFANLINIYIYLVFICLNNLRLTMSITNIDHTKEVQGHDAML